MRLEVKPPLVHAFDLAADPGWTRDSATGSTSGTEPGSWNTTPWLNLFFGGTAIGNDDLLLPVITGADQVVNLAVRTMIDGSLSYPAGESGSSTHVGTGAGLFALDAEGLLGCKFQLVTGGLFTYGWVRVVVDNLGAGTIRDWAYDNTDRVGIPAGFTGVVFVPEPGRAMLVLGGIAFALSRRRRAARWWLGAGPLPISSTCCQSRASTSPRPSGTSSPSDSRLDRRAPSWQHRRIDESAATETARVLPLDHRPPGQRFHRRPPPAVPGRLPCHGAISRA